jgi:hypothetical protein
MKSKEPVQQFRKNNMPMSQRLDRIGELLAKGVYLYIKKNPRTQKDAIDSGLQKELINNKMDA